MKYSMLREFHRKFNFPAPDQVADIDPSLLIYRAGLLKEEMIEFEEAVDGLLIGPTNHDRRQLLDAMVDMIYVIMGTAMLYGFDLDEAFRRVHAANMAKERAVRAADAKRGSTYDVVKPPGWQSPDLSDLADIFTVGELLCEANGSNSACGSPRAKIIQFTADAAKSSDPSSGE